MASEHQSMLRQSVEDFVLRGTDIARVRALRGSDVEYDRKMWAQMAELGWLGITVAEAQGGLGMGLSEAAIVAEGLGRALAPEPFNSAAVMVPAAVRDCEQSALRDELLSAVATGERIGTLAWQEQAGTIDSGHIQLSAMPFEGGYRLNGTKRYVSGAAGADFHIVAARSPEDGLVLVCVAHDASGVSLELEPLTDGRKSGTLNLSDATVGADRIVARGAAAEEALARALDHGRAIASAELYGVMSRALDMSVDYMKTRKQFGRAIGSFQALQHRAVDLYIQQQLASATLEESLRVLDEEPEAPRRAAVASRLKARCAEAAIRITREAIQIHGAIGFTDEYDAGLYLKRALVLGAWLGNATQHRRRYAELTIGKETAHV